jgi:glycosyltransferase involved in cell wall biosynthesis
MRILHVIYSLRNGGAERIVVDLAKELTNRGHINQICLVSPINKFQEEFDGSNGKEIKCHSLLNKNNSRFLPNIPIIIFRLKKIVKIFKPDIIHCHLRNDSALCGFIKNVPIIRTVQNSRPLQSYNDLSFSNKLIAWLEKRSFKKSNISIVACNRTSEKVLNSFLTKFSKSCVTVISNGINLSRLDSSERQLTGNTKSNIITIGTLCKVKNHSMAILALNELLKRNIDCYLWVLGEGIEKSNLEKLAEDLNLSKRVKFIGKFKNVNDYLRQGALYWSTSISEGFSIANLEAISMGVPAIVTDVDGNQEMLQPWPYCRVPLNDYNRLAEVSASLLRNPQLLKETAGSMKEYIFTKYNISVMVKQYILLYKKTILAKQE